MNGRMKQLASTLLATATLLAGNSALAGSHWQHRERAAFTDRARVISVEPVYRRVEVPVDTRECHEAVIESRREVGTTPGMGTLVGTIIGGVVGSQLGQGNGRRVATAAGTVIGAAVGHDMERREGGSRTVVEPRMERRCTVRTRYDEVEELEGYRVTLRYKGHVMTRMMDHDPGRFVRVRVVVMPVED